MRILLLSDEPKEPSMGGPKVALKLQAALRELGHECTALFRPDLGARPRSPRLRLALGPLLARAALGRGGLADYDVVDAASAEGWLLPGRSAGPALVARSHGLEHRYYRELLQDADAGLIRKPWTHRIWYPAVRLPQVAAALRRAERVIVPHPEDGEEIAARGWQPRERIAWIPHGVDERWLEAAPGAEAARGGGLLYCGWWTEAKGVSYLAAAHAALLRQGLRVPLTLFGVGMDEAPASLEARVRGAFAPESQALLRIHPRTRDEAEVFAQYQRHDLLVCASSNEGFGLVVLEALSQRLPVVCSRAAGAAALLEDGREGRLTPARAPEALAAAIAELWRDPARRRGMGEAGHRLARGLGWRAIAAQTLSVYESAVEERRGREG